MSVSRWSHFAVFSSVLALASCGVSTMSRDLAPAKENKQSESQAPNPAVPTLMIAKTSAKDLDSSENSAAEFVVVKRDMKINSGAEAAAAFAAGAPAPLPGRDSLSLSGKNNEGFTMGMPAQVPVQMGDPCDPCAQSKGQIYTTNTGVTRGFFPRVGAFLRRLNPLARIGGTTIPYGYNNQYTYQGNNYTVYQQGMPFQQVQYTNTGTPPGQQNQQDLPH
jgi:hypothetical protein